MKPRDEQPPAKDKTDEPEASRVEEARRNLEEYAASLREIIRKLRRYLD